jgi:hypothetical protein
MYVIESVVRARSKIPKKSSKNHIVNLKIRKTADEKNTPNSAVKKSRREFESARIRSKFVIFNQDIWPFYVLVESKFM